MASRMFRQNMSGDEIIQLMVRLGLLAFLIYWSFVLVRPFIPDIGLSMVLTVALYPPYSWLSMHLGDRPKLAAATITLTILAIIIGPVTWLGFGLADGLQDIAGQLGSGHASHSVASRRRQGLADRRRADRHPPGQCFDKLRAAASRTRPAFEALGRSGTRLAGSAGFGMLKFVASVATVGFLVPLRPRLVAAIRSIQARLVTQRSQDFVAPAGLTIRTVAQGVIGVAGPSSAAGRIGLKLAGVPHAGLLAFAVLILRSCKSGRPSSLFPSSYGFGQPRISPWRVPLTIYLLIVGVADNVLKPMLMGRGLNTPMLVIFIGAGGMLAHGIPACLSGPSSWR